VKISTVGSVRLWRLVWQQDVYPEPGSRTLEDSASEMREVTATNNAEHENHVMHDAHRTSSRSTDCVITRLYDLDPALELPNILH
jgi:hypothetical protein